MINDFVISDQEREEIINTFFASITPLRLKELPSRLKKKVVVLKEIANLFERDKIYKESKVNDIIAEVYPDYALIRRYLVDLGLINRTKDCSSYWI